MFTLVVHEAYYLEQLEILRDLAFARYAKEGTNS